MDSSCHLKRGHFKRNIICLPSPSKIQRIFNTCFWVSLKGGRWHIILQLAVYTTFISSIACLYRTYCWWTKSCTTWDVYNPVNNGINYLSTGAGFLPSTVPQYHLLREPGFTPLRYSLVLGWKIKTLKKKLKPTYANARH